MKFEIIQKCILISAMRGSGKSELVKYILKSFIHQFNDHLIICPTNFSGFYDKSIYKVIYNFDDDKLGELINYLSIINDGKDKKSKDFHNMLLVLDDCISDINFKKCKNLQNIIVRGRHYGITLIFITQYLKSQACPPIVRNNADYIFLGKQNRQSLEIAENEYNIYNNKQNFMDMMKKCGFNFQFVIINNGSISNKDKYGIFRVPNI